MPDRKSDQFGTPQEVIPSLLSFPVAATTSLYAGDMIATDASGNAIAAGTAGALKIWGRCEADAINTVAAGVGTAGDIQVTVRQGVFGQLNAAGVLACTAADIGNIVYASGPQTVSRTNGGGAYLAAGKLYKVATGAVYVGLGMSSLYDDHGDTDTQDIISYRARNVVNGNVADLAAYTVASNAAVNDATLNVEGDVVLLVGQTTAAQNGVYRVGIVDSGTAPLTRVGAASTFIADQYEVAVSAGTRYGHTKWFNTAAGTFDTNDPGFYPESVTISQVLTAGTAAALSIPLLSATKSNVLYTRTATGGTLTNTVGYQTVPAPTPGPIGTASIVPMAVVAAGTIQNLDTSTLLVTVVNR